MSSLNAVAQWDNSDVPPHPDDPWTSHCSGAPWMVELHRIGQQVAFFGDDLLAVPIVDWRDTSRVFAVDHVWGTASYLGIRREGQTEYRRINFVFTSGDFQSRWTGEEPPR